MAVLWPIVLLVGVIAIVLGPVLLVTKHMVLVGIVLGTRPHGQTTAGVWRAYLRQP